MGNCGSCKHWDHDKHEILNDEGWGECKLSEGYEGGKIKNKTILMYAKDYDASEAWLMTEASFGCVLFEKE